MCQSTRFVAEDVFDLTEVVRDVPAFGNARVIEFFVVHFDVGVDEEDLSGFDDFDGDVQGDRNQVLEENYTGPECYDAVFGGGATYCTEFEEVC